LVPLVKGIVDDRKLAKQKVFDAELARQGKFLESQAQLLDTVDRILWNYHKILLKVTYYSTLGDKNKHRAAVEEYQSETWRLLADLRAELSNARRLTSPEVYERLHRLFLNLVGEIDQKVVGLVGPEGFLILQGLEHRQKLHDYIFWNVGTRIEEVLTALAFDVQLAKGSPQPSELPAVTASVPTMQSSRHIDLKSDDEGHSGTPGARS
jgi:hypothetical protein